MIVQYKMEGRFYREASVQEVLIKRLLGILSEDSGNTRCIELRTTSTTNHLKLHICTVQWGITENKDKYRFLSYM